MCRAIRVRRFQSMSRQDILQYVIVGLLTGCFWWQRGGHDTLAASADTLGEHFLLSALFCQPFYWGALILIGCHACCIWHLTMSGLFCLGSAIKCGLN